ncbi:protein HEG isoform X2 [Nerophis lumbriciformis]|uniref:protein HEG isoform X2 n=1 Tax=Nerophis lumbriciformis TaxID=546530 RepID=UPI002ADF0744|nr:protein HEG-like isoform X2 [Nerophis lumbriciformis]
MTNAGCLGTMKRCWWEPLLLLLLGLLVALPGPLGAGTPTNSSPDAGTTAFRPPNTSDQVNTEYELTSAFPSTESFPPSQRDLPLTLSPDTEQPQTRRETSTRSQETIGASTEMFTSSTDGHSSETSSSSSSDWRDSPQTPHLPDVSLGISDRALSPRTVTEELPRDSPRSSVRTGEPASSPSQTQALTGRIFNATAVSRAGERTLLSVTSSSSSNSSAVTQDFSSHQPRSTWSVASTVETEDYTHSAPSTRSEETRSRSLTASSSSEPDSPETPAGTQTLVGPLNATQHQYIPTSEEPSQSTRGLSSTDPIHESTSSTPPAGLPTLTSYPYSTVQPSTESSTGTGSFSTRRHEGTESSPESREESVSFIVTTAPPLVSSTTNQYDSQRETTAVFIATTTVTGTDRSEVTEEETDVNRKSTAFTSVPPLLATSSSTLGFTPQPSTQATISSTTGAPTPPQQMSAAPPALGRVPTASAKTTRPADVTAWQRETSAGATTPQGPHSAATHTRTNPTERTEAPPTTRVPTDRVTTEEVEASSPTHVQPTKAAPPRDPCVSNPCLNGGMCVSYEHRRFRCGCPQAWTGPTCNQDMDECEKDPCPVGSTCVNTRGSFSCECPLGFHLEDGRTCTRAKTFLGTFSLNKVSHDNRVFKSATVHEIQRELLQLLNASLSILRGYSRSTLSKKEVDGIRISAVNMFSVSTDVTSADVYNSIQMSLKNCTSWQSHCRVVLHHTLTYQVESLCLAQNIPCDSERSACSDVSGSAQCQCLQGYYKHDPDDLSCLECGDGYRLENNTCVPCIFGFGGFNCGNFYKLIAVVVSPAGGALLLILVIALIVTCCKRDKNDINKIIFKSGDLQMSPYADFPKTNRISTEWGRETIEMQENGSTKNLLQMTDIYYSPALRNSDLERNGLYPFTGLPGSRHSCIYPAQWNPSFTSDDSRRRDYF